MLRLTIALVIATAAAATGCQRAERQPAEGEESQMQMMEDSTHMMNDSEVMDDSGHMMAGDTAHQM